MACKKTVFRLSIGPKMKTVINKKPVITIVGRPNVGKSTLFNRLIGKRLAVISEEPGTTRDRIQYDMDINGYNVELIDTGGLYTGKKEDLAAETEKQAKIGIEKANIILFVIDAIEDLTADDLDIASILRKSKKEIILVANKCDNLEIENSIYTLYKLGLGDPIQVSSIHKIGVDTLLNEIAQRLKKLKFKKGASSKNPPRNFSGNSKNSINNSQKQVSKDLKISIVGRPNVGKSSLLNSLLGEERVIVSDIPGTTRDTTNTEINYKDNKITLIDTAGIRKRGRIQRGIEKFSIIRCKEAIIESDVAIILLDATEVATSQDLHVIELVLKERKGVILAINKSDLLKSETEKERILRLLKYKCDFLPWASVVFISAKNKKNIFKLLDLALEIQKTRTTEISTHKLNSFLQKIVTAHTPASTGISKTKLFYGSQTGINPPKFTLFFSHVKYLHFSYKRYLENEMRKEFGMQGTPISITFRESPSKEK